ncbi:hypothetical protein BDV98DRAFT_571328 [Pterulicium gracile]|uniref:N-acetyltransferase domain-containing protein n=1 Tax=Pterulicium gracile TaxID=1884261 RepID=A0A5C3QFM4_9AGAR|nr:hypothetical protein BDV98DRAFT_571328 [Pterula gracilis]
MAESSVPPEQARYLIKKLDSSALTPGVMDKIVSFSVEAFDQGRDPWVAAATGGVVSLADGMLRSRVAAGMVAEGGRVYVAYEAQGSESEPVGVAVWMMPGEDLYATTAQKEAHYIAWQRQVDPTVAAWCEHNMMLPVEQLVGNVRKDTWNLAFLAVDPRHHRRGIAKLLIGEVQRIALNRREGLSVLTQSRSNVGVYEVLGFQLRSNLEIVGGVGGDFTVYFLVQLVEGLL